MVRANQGHGHEIGRFLDVGSLLSEIRDAGELEARNEAPVHGTSWSAWEAIQQEGLRPMGREHVHFAARPPGSIRAISGMRKASQIFIYLDVPRALEAGMRLFRSQNDVILTAGHAGVVAPEFFDHVRERKGNKLLWKPERAASIRCVVAEHATSGAVAAVEGASSSHAATVEPRVGQIPEATADAIPASAWEKYCLLYTSPSPRD